MNNIKKRYPEVYAEFERAGMLAASNPICGFFDNMDVAEVQNQETNLRKLQRIRFLAEVKINKLLLWDEFNETFAEWKKTKCKFLDEVDSNFFSDYLWDWKNPWENRTTVMQVGIRRFLVELNDLAETENDGDHNFWNLFGITWKYLSRWSGFIEISASLRRAYAINHFKAPAIFRPYWNELTDQISSYIRSFISDEQLKDGERLLSHLRQCEAAVVKPRY